MLMTATSTRDTSTQDTSTPEGASRTRIEVRRSALGGRCEVELACVGAPDRPVVRPMLLSSDDAEARVSLVPEGALLLASDRIEIEVVVGPGARLELIEPGGTVAYAMHGGTASWAVTVDLADGARLAWAGEPFVVAQGAQVRRHTRVRLGAGARLALRELLVLGRHGERPGRIEQSFVALGPHDEPMLAESLAVGPDSPRLLLAARVVGTVTVLGARLPDHLPGTRLELESEGTLLRSLDDEAHLAVHPTAWAEARELTR